MPDDQWKQRKNRNIEIGKEIDSLIDTEKYEKALEKCNELLTAINQTDHFPTLTQKFKCYSNIWKKLKTQKSLQELIDSMDKLLESTPKENIHDTKLLILGEIGYDLLANNLDTLDHQWNTEKKISKIETKLDEVLPTGTILLWYGDKNSIPHGWSVCDGKDNLTPDLTKSIPTNNINILDKIKSEMEDLISNPSKNNLSNKKSNQEKRKENTLSYIMKTEKIPENSNYKEVDEEDK